MIRSHRATIAATLAAATLAVAGCGGSPSAPSDEGATTPVTLIWTGELSPQGSSLYPLTLSQASNVALTLVSLSTGPLGIPAPATLALALGNLTEDGVCEHTNEVRASPALKAHLSLGTYAGSRCVELTDQGALGGPTQFAVQIVHSPVAGTPPTKTPGPGTDRFNSTLPPLGSVSRSIVASQAGTITVNIEVLPPTAVIGVGLGVPRLDGGGCLLTTWLRASGGAPPIVAAVDEGLYCERVFDLGQITAPVTFTLTTTFP